MGGDLLGLTLIRKSEGRGPVKDPTVALVLAGGAVSGGAFKVGGLKALDDFLVGRKITDFDMYVGLSAGSLLAVSLAAGITPDEMVKVLEGTSGRFKQLSPLDFYTPNLREFLERPAKFVYDLAAYLPGVGLDLARALPELPRVLGPSLRNFVREPSYTHAEAVLMRLLEFVSPSREIPALTNHVPTALFDNSGLERWLRDNLERIRMPNDFESFERRRRCQLYIAACDLDTAERVVFGADEKNDVTISQAVQASTALPLFYRPARIGGIDYVDGGVRNTANIDVAIEKGADLIICYNPFRPFSNRVVQRYVPEKGKFVTEGKRLADQGILVVLNQVFRTLLHSRLQYGLRQYQDDPNFRGDIIVVEPTEHDTHFFAMNPLAFWDGPKAGRHGYVSVTQSIETHYDVVKQILQSYGILMTRREVREGLERMRRFSSAQESQDVLTRDVPRRNLDVA